MSDRFVPFNSGESGPERFKPLGDKDETPSCQHDSKDPGEQPKDESAAEPKAPAAPPNIILHRNGGTIAAIEIECPCGQHVVLTCDYGDGSAN